MTSAISELTKLDLFLWYHFKQLFYTRKDVKRRIRHVFRDVDENTLINVNNPE